MPCDTIRKSPQQTLAERAKEVRAAGAKIDGMLARGQVKVKVDRRTGGVVFDGIDAKVRDGMTDACVYRAIMARGSHAARQAIVKAERMAGRAVDKKAVLAGLHSHDGGATWGTD